MTDQTEYRWLKTNPVKWDGESEILSFWVAARGATPALDRALRVEVTAEALEAITGANPKTEGGEKVFELHRGAIVAVARSAATPSARSLYLDEVAARHFMPKHAAR